MTDYGSLGYNQFLQKTDSIPAMGIGSVTPSIDFDSQNERGLISQPHLGSGIIGSLQIQDASITSAKIVDASITNAKIGTAAIGTANIGTLSFNEISGGTANIGGLANGNGVLTVNSSNGGNLITLNNTGMVVSNSNSISFLGTPGSHEGVINMAGSTFHIDNNSDSASSSIAIECLAGNISIAADGGTFTMWALGGAGVFRFKSATGVGGTIAELDKDGNLKIAGTIGTGISF